MFTYADKISLCMIVKNEEPFIARALNSVKTVMGLTDLVVADTGSEDKTKALAAGNGARVIDFKWCGDFSAARNHSAENAAHDWVFVLDADEEVTEADAESIRVFIRESNRVGWATRLEKADNIYSSPLRLYNRKYFKYEGIIHEQIRPFAIKAGFEKYEKVSIEITHYGFVEGEERTKEKLERNERLLIEALAARPDDPYLLYQLGKRYFFKRSDLAKAREYFTKALSKHPDARLEYVYDLVECLGYALINTGQYKQALALAEEYIKYYDNNPHFRFLLAHIYQNNGMLSEAVDYFKSCVGADIKDLKGITSFLSYYNIGIILECVGMTDDAKQMYIKCGDYKPAKERLKAL